MRCTPTAATHSHARCCWDKTTDVGSCDACTPNDAFLYCTRKVDCTGAEFCCYVNGVSTCSLMCAAGGNSGILCMTDADCIASLHCTKDGTIDVSPAGGRFGTCK